MTAKAQYDKDGNLIPLILTPPNKYGYRVNVVDHEDGRRAYEEYQAGAAAIRALCGIG